MPTSAENRIFHGKITPNNFARALIGEFNRGNWKAVQLGNHAETVVQITSRERPPSGGATALSVTLRRVEDGVAVQIGKQAWLGLAASLGQTVLETVADPWRLINRLDDLAQDVESLQLTERIWMVIENTARAHDATLELSERLRRLTCEYCQAANPVGESTCVACGAPLGRVQPRTCRTCGYVVRIDEATCPNCKSRL